MEIERDLDGLGAIVTGAARGIGAAIALALARRGAKIALLVRPTAIVEIVEKSIVESGGHCVVIYADVSDPDAVERGVLRAQESLGRLDVLVNNAGVIEPIGHLADTPPDAWIRSVSVNLMGAYLMARAVLPGFVKQEHGVIVNISSGAAHTPREGWSAYCAAKAGVAMLTRSLDLEYRDRGVRVYGLQPGLVDTEMQVRIRASGMNEISRVSREKLQKPDRPAKVAAWLCSEAAIDLAGRELSMNDIDLRRRAGVEA